MLYSRRRIREVKLWHATTIEAAAAILRGGVNMEAQRRNDVGDLGWGFYLTGSMSRARCYGRGILEIEIHRDQFAVVSNPYFLKGMDVVRPKTEDERLFYSLAFDELGDMMTCSGRYDRAAKETAARNIRLAFLELGCAGIISDYSDGEVVVFAAEGIVSIKEAL